MTSKLTNLFKLDKKKTDNLYDMDCDEKIKAKYPEHQNNEIYDDENNEEESKSFDINAKPKTKEGNTKETKKKTSKGEKKIIYKEDKILKSEKKKIAKSKEKKTKNKMKKEKIKETEYNTTCQKEVFVEEDIYDDDEEENNENISTMEEIGEKIEFEKEKLNKTCKKTQENNVKLTFEEIYDEDELEKRENVNDNLCEELYDDDERSENESNTEKEEKVKTIFSTKPRSKKSKSDFEQRNEDLSKRKFEKEKNGKKHENSKVENKSEENLEENCKCNKKSRMNIFSGKMRNYLLSNKKDKHSEIQKESEKKGKNKYGREVLEKNENGEIDEVYEDDDSDNDSERNSQELCKKDNGRQSCIPEQTSMEIYEEEDDDDTNDFEDEEVYDDDDEFSCVIKNSSEKDSASKLCSKYLKAEEKEADEMNKEKQSCDEILENEVIKDPMKRKKSFPKDGIESNEDRDIQKSKMVMHKPQCPKSKRKNLKSPINIIISRIKSKIKEKKYKDEYDCDDNVVENYEDDSRHCTEDLHEEGEKNIETNTSEDVVCKTKRKNETAKKTFNFIQRHIHKTIIKTVKSEIYDEDDQDNDVMECEKINCEETYDDDEDRESENSTETESCTHKNNKINYQKLHHQKSEGSKTISTKENEMKLQDVEDSVGMFSNKCEENIYDPTNYEEMAIQDDNDTCILKTYSSSSAYIKEIAELKLVPVKERRKNYENVSPT